jgi:hypothetical protein
MRSRSTLEWSGIALGAAAQGVWCGVLAALLSGAAWPALAAFAAGTMLAAAAVARWTGSGADRLRRGRLLLAAVVLVSSAVLFAAGRSWLHEYILWQIVRDASFAIVLVLLGVWLGRADMGPDEAFGRAVRAFAALCAVLALAGLTGTSLAGPAAAVATVVVAGGLHVAVTRYRTLAEVVPDDDRLPAWPWLLAVAATICAVLVVTGLVAALAGGTAARAASGGLQEVLGYVADAVGWIVGGVFRAVAWLGGLVHLHLPHREPPQVKGIRTITLNGTGRRQGSVVPEVVLLGAAAAAALAVAVAVVVFALRRLSGRPARDDAVLEEREAVGSLRSATARSLRGLRRRLLSLPGVRRKAHTPAELIRLRYERLEGRLAKLGRPRAAGTTVRDHLASCAAGAQSGLAAELAAAYELARYSDRAVDEALARRFGELAGALRPPAVESDPAATAGG